MQAFFNWTKFETRKVAALFLIAAMFTFLPDGRAMGESRERIQLICDTSGVADPSAFCDAVAKSLSAASNAVTSVVKEGAFAGDGLAARLKFTVNGQSGRALIETGVVMNGQFIARSSETSGVQTMDAAVETGAVQLLANMLATRLKEM